MFRVFDEHAFCSERPWHRRQTEPPGKVTGVFENVFQRRGRRGGCRHGYCGYNWTEVNTGAVMSQAPKVPASS